MENANQKINVSVTFRGTEPTEALKNYAIEKITNCLKKFVLADSDARVVLAIEKRDHSAEVVLQSKGHDTVLKSTTDDLYSAIDKLVDTLSRQLRKQKDKIVDKHQAARL